MKSNHRSPIWPYLLVLVALFALCVTAPRGWQTKPIAHRTRPAERLISTAGRKPRSEPPTVLLAESSRAPHTSASDLITSRVVSSSLPSPLQMANPLAGATSIAPLEATAVSPANETGDGLQSDRVSAAGSPHAISELESFVSTNVEGALAVDGAITGSEVLDPSGDTGQQVAPVQPEPTAISSYDGSVDEDPARNYENWPLPLAIIDRLERFQQHETARHWADEVRLLVDQLALLRIDDSAAMDLLRHLRMTTDKGSLAKTALTTVDERDLEQLQLDLFRRVDLWEKAAQASEGEPVSIVANGVDNQMQESVVSIGAMLEKEAAGDTWRRFLLLDKLSRLARDSSDESTSQRRRTAEIVLARMADPRLNSAQKRVLVEPRLLELKRHLRRWTVEKLPLGELLYTVEDYEQARVASLGRTVVEQSAILAGARESAEKRLGCELARQYRNANLRIVVTRELLNRLLPQPEPSLEPVNDTIVGVTARGRSTTSTKLAVRLFPARDQIRFGIEAAGVVDSQTASTAGPVTFFSQGESSYRVGKLVVIDRGGLSVGTAMADADDQTRLSGLQTDFDGVPLVRNLVRGYALSQHEEKQVQARQEVEAKVAARASQRLDTEVNARLAKADAEIRQRILAPLQKLELTPEVVQLTTTAERVTARLRLAGDDQAGAHTPRPLAMSDSLASVQIHETAINNALDRFGLAGRTFTLPELYQWIGGLLGRIRVELPEDLPENVTITFAEHDPLRVRCGDGRVELTLAVAELDEGRRVWHDFEITVFYRPRREGLRLEFAREGAIELSGEGYKGRTEVVLRGIFAKVFSHRRKLTIDPGSDNPNPALATLAFSSALVDNGWISVTIADAKAAGER